MNPKLSFDERADYGDWKAKIREKFIELTGLDDIEKNVAPEPKFEIERREQKDGYEQIRFTFLSESGSVVTCYLLIPELGRKKYPVVITLQGHSTGFHNSIGEPKFEEDKKYQPRGAFAVQAVREGYVALAIEQRGMGERAPQNEDFRRVNFGPNGGDYYSQMTGILLGRTLIGERCFDISRAIDMLNNFPECDTDKIVITGNSGGGTASYYAAAYDS
jgi:cephalosporin-C deacetylase-like acetyl esterase